MMIIPKFKLLINFEIAKQLTHTHQMMMIMIEVQIENKENYHHLDPNDNDGHHHYYMLIMDDYGQSIQQLVDNKYYLKFSVNIMIIIIIIIIMVNLPEESRP